MIADIRMIAAIGRQGQIGLGDTLPWHDADDLAWFRDQTMGCAVIVGRRTAAALPALPGRHLLIWAGEDPQAFVARAFAEYARFNKPTGPVWIAGGRRTYQAFMPYVRRSYVTHVAYDGPADVLMPPLWGDGEIEGVALVDRNPKRT